MIGTASRPAVFPDTRPLPVREADLEALLAERVECQRTVAARKLYDQHHCDAIDTPADDPIDGLDEVAADCANRDLAAIVNAAHCWHQARHIAQFVAPVLFVGLAAAAALYLHDRNQTAVPAAAKSWQLDACMER